MAFTLRRCQSRLARGQRPAPMARPWGGATQRVRQTMQAFYLRGVARLQAPSCRPTQTRWVLDAAPLRALLHERPRAFGQPRRTWTLRLAAEICWERGLTSSHVSRETSRQALKRLGMRWRCAKR